MTQSHLPGPGRGVTEAVSRMSVSRHSHVACLFARKVRFFVFRQLYESKPVPLSRKKLVA